ncbi:Phage tail fiber protein [Collimonas arenae]|uniref:Phage tail fiber protein n=1 Tax=Collimonas arenae TaxID=279058 RepID=A0A0A1FH46_9BURK|nr:tail fiber protein [Collimonas arenae]AIY42995.1 Phage tail fiber protein [Collimonas arenae]
MATINEQDIWEETIYEIATTDDVVGGPGGIANRQAHQLANRTLHLSTGLSTTISSTGTLSTSVSSALSTTVSNIAALSTSTGTGLSTASSNITSLSTATAMQTANAAPVGEVAYFASAALHAGWLKANGAAVSRTTYADLFAAIGTIYGAGDGNKTFHLPDLRGEFIRGFDDGRGIDVGRTFGSGQAEDFRLHNHGPSGIVSASGSVAGSVDAGIALGGSNFWKSTTTAATGGTETRPRNLALLACIKY